MTASPVSVDTEGADITVRDIALIRLIVIETPRSHDALTAGIGRHEAPAVAETDHGSGTVNSRRARAVGADHLYQNTAAADLLDGTGVLARHVGDHLLHRLELRAVLIIMEENFRQGTWNS